MDFCDEQRRQPQPQPELAVGGLFTSDTLRLPLVHGRRPRVGDAHWVYFIQGDDGGPIKIGRTQQNPQWRVDALQCGYPFGKLRLIWLIRGTGLLERELHERFKKSRLRGEWFTPSDEVLGFLEQQRANWSVIHLLDPADPRLTKAAA